MTSAYGRWLTPTSAWRLAQCAASAGYSSGPLPPRRQRLTTAGEAAHAAMKRWIESGDWFAPTPRLQEHYDIVCDANGLQVEALANGRLTRARLGAREVDLASLLTRVGDRPEADCEKPLVDPEKELWGVPDIVVRGGQTAVVDLKTGGDVTRPLPDQLSRQLLIYAHLVRTHDGEPPSLVAIFSLAHGVIELEASARAIEELLDRIAAARSLPGMATPRADACRFCAQRRRCEPHWNAAANGELPDAVEGAVVRTEVAESGSIAVQLETSAGRVWLTRLRPTMLAGQVAPGCWLRAVRLIAPSTEPPTWRAAPETMAWPAPLANQH